MDEGRNVTETEGKTNARGKGHFVHVALASRRHNASSIVLCAMVEGI